MATIAIPEYKDYTIRAKVAEAIAGTAGIRMDFEECLQAQKEQKGCSDTWPDFSSQYVEGIQYDSPRSHFLVTLQNIPELEENRRRFYMVPWVFDDNGKPQYYTGQQYKNSTQSINWTCMTLTPQNHMLHIHWHQFIEAKYLPNTCFKGGIAKDVKDFDLQGFAP